MDYVAALRGRKALWATSIALGVLLAISAIVRLSLGPSMEVGPSFTDLSRLKGSVTTHAVLPDGAKETIIENKRLRQRAVVIDRGYFGTILRHTYPAKAKQHDTGLSSGPFFSHARMVKNGFTTSTLRVDAPTDFGFFWYVSLVVGLVLATVLSGAFSSENDGHLEMSFVRPRPRENLALRIIASDIVTIVMAEIITAIFAVAALAVYLDPRLTFSGDTFAPVLYALLAPIAWYAMLLAATASIRRGRGLVVGCAWPLAFILPAAFAGTTGTSIPLVDVVHAILVPLVRLDPLWFMQHFSITSKTIAFGVTLGIAEQPAIIGLSLLAFMYLVVAILQWRRVEA